jgi:hypothetical protein
MKEIIERIDKSGFKKLNALILSKYILVKKKNF